MSDVFDVANKSLDEWHFQKWLCYAYGVLISSARELLREGSGRADYRSRIRRRGINYWLFCG